MATSPDSDAEGVVRVSLYSEGNSLAAVRIISVTIHRAINRVPSARIELVDGDMPTKEFPLSDSADFKPGAAIKIAAGYGDDEEAIFEGVVVKHSIQITGDNDSRLVIECRDKAVKMTVGRKNANYVDKLDSDLISTLIGNHGLTASVTATSIQHKELVQYYSSDWDYMLARADANGLVVIATDGTVAVKAPDTSTAAALKVTWGMDLMEFHAEMDARTQYASAKAVSWDMKNQQALVGSDASPPTLNTQGDLTQATLSEVVGLASYRLQTAAPVTQEVLTAWAKAQQLKSGLSRIRGDMRFQGSAKAKPGTLIEVEGVGTRYSGSVYVSAVRHEIVDGDWTTEATFGLAPQWITEQPDVTAPPAAGLVPGIEGLQTGVVMKLDADPENEHRVQVSVPVMQAETDGVWARLLQFHGSNAFGSFFVPEVGDEVVLGYFNNDPAHPVILGSLYSSKHAPPYTLEAANNTKAIVTRCKSKIEFDEEKKIITVTTPGNNKIVLSDDGKSILLQDQNSNKVELNSSGITLDSPKDIKITAKGGITLDAVNAIKLTSKADVKIAGLNVAAEAQVGLTAKGNANAELSAAGQTVVKGAMVMIN
jgi:Rhs element Vgr protein